LFWPDFRRSHLEAAINEFRRRERRFGGLAPAAAPVRELIAAAVGGLRVG
jgi:undecaprenyl diphosphate synthase